MTLGCETARRPPFQPRYSGSRHGSPLRKEQESPRDRGLHAEGPGVRHAGHARASIAGQCRRGEPPMKARTAAFVLSAATLLMGVSPPAIAQEERPQTSTARDSALCAPGTTGRPPDCRPIDNGRLDRPPSKGGPVKESRRERCPRGTYGTHPRCIPSSSLGVTRGSDVAQLVVTCPPGTAKNSKGACAPVVRRQPQPIQ